MDKNNYNNNLAIESSEEHKILAKNTFYSFFNTYGNLIFMIIGSFLVARLLTQYEWGILILATSYITIISVILNYFPPAVEPTLNYYLSRFIALGENEKIKPFIIRISLLKVIFIIPIFFLSIIIFQLFEDFFFINLDGNINLIYYLTPLILILGFTPVLRGINRSFDMFKTLFFLTIITYSFQIFSLLSLFFLKSEIRIEYIAFIDLIAAFIPFILNCLLIILKLRKIKINKKKDVLIKSFYRKVFKYGFPISFGYIIYGFWDQIQIQGIGVFNSAENITGYNIALSYSSYSILLINSFSHPLTTSFSRLNSNLKHDKIKLIYKLILKYSLLLFSFISGILFFISKFFLYLVYGETYIIYDNYMKLLIIASIFRVVTIPLDSLILAQNKVKFFPFIKMTMILIYCSTFFLGLIINGIIGGIVGIIFSNLLILCLYTVLSKKIVDIKINLKDLVIQYFIFFLSVGSTYYLSHFFINDIYQNLLKTLNLTLFNYLPVFSILIFTFIFIFLYIFIGVFSESDFNYLKANFDQDKLIDNFILKILGFLNKLNKIRLKK